MVQLLSRSLRRWHTIFKGAVYDRKNEARSQRASDIHISEGQAVYLRIDGKLIKSDLELSDEMTRKLILSLLTKERQESIWRGEDADFALETSDGNNKRRRFCAFTR